VDPAISPLRIDDYDEVLRLWSATEGMQLRTADSRAGIALYLERNPGSSFVARVGSEVVGAVLCGHDGRRGYLHHLAVAPAHRRRGLATALLNRALAGLAQQGIAKCLGFVLADNQDGLAFWARTGWEHRADLEVVSVVLGADPNA
jgi:ribosomal protein S18 acetylase RimI-like enzyme